jgi:hypothetical protein
MSKLDAKSFFRRILPSKFLYSQNPNFQLHHIEQEIEMLRMEVVQSRIREFRELQSLGDLSDAEFRVFSQWGEDGIIQYLISKVPIENKVFIEFGVEDYRESNTRFLLINNNWSGLVIDSNPKFINNIRAQNYYWRHDLTAICDFVTVENINSIIKQSGIEGDIGLLSIDVDGNDYWIWEAVTVVSPRIVVVEYNSVFGRDRAVTIPYQPDFNRTKAHYSNLYFGASLRAFCLQAERKGYLFVGSNSAGSNAFFVRKDVALGVKEKDPTIDFVESKLREARDKAGKLIFTSGIARRELISDMPVVDVENNTNIVLADVAG